MELELDHQSINEQKIEQKMEQNAITMEMNDLNSLKIDGTLDNPISDVEKDKKELVTNPNHNSLLLQNINCRICLAMEEASEADPIIQLGCQCKDDISFGHESCLKNWFVRRLLRNGFLDCELCKSPLGAYLEEIVKNKVLKVTTSNEMQGVKLVLVLLQVPPNELDHLQVPHNIPDFYELPPETRCALRASLERQEQVHQSNESRRSAIFMEAQNLAAYGEGPFRTDQLQARILRAIQLREQFFFVPIEGPILYYNTDDDNNEDRNTYHDNNEDQNTDNDNDEDRDIYDGNTEDQDTNDGNMDLREFWEEDVRRVAVEGLSTIQQREELIDELSLHADSFAEDAQETREGMIFLHHSYFSQRDRMLDTNASTSLTQQTTPASRQYTYGRFQLFSLHDIV